jgi:hypothetical protein
VVRHGEKLFNRFKPEDAADLILTHDQEFFADAYNLVTSAAKLSDMLFPTKAGSPPIHEERSDSLKALFAHVSTAELRRRELRNKIEHFAEELDKHNLKATKLAATGRLKRPNNAPEVLFLCEAVLGQATPKAIQGIPLPTFEVPPFDQGVVLVRVYVTSTQTFHSFSYTADCAALVREAQGVNDAVRLIQPDVGGLNPYMIRS